MQNMKKNLPLIIAAVGILIVLIGGSVFAYTKMSKKPADAGKKEETKKKRVSLTPNLIPVAERPYIQISPKDGRNITLSINEVKKSATSAEYELEYQTESNLEGAVGTLELASLPVSKDILLGSCSAGGACRYHKDVKGGTLLVKMMGGEAYAVKTDWKYIENTKRESEFSSKDGKFQISSKDLAKQGLLIIFNSPGYPKTPSGTVISDVYTLSTAGALSGKATVTIRAAEEAAGAKILGWDGSAWKEFSTKMDGKSATAEVDFMDAYVVVKK